MGAIPEMVEAGMMITISLCSCGFDLILSQISISSFDSSCSFHLVIQGDSYSVQWALIKINEWSIDHLRTCWKTCSPKVSLSRNRNRQLQSFKDASILIPTMNSWELQQLNMIYPAYPHPNPPKLHPSKRQGVCINKLWEMFRFPGDTGQNVNASQHLKGCGLLGAAWEKRFTPPPHPHLVVSPVALYMPQWQNSEALRANWYSRDQPWFQKDLNEYNVFRPFVHI